MDNLPLETEQAKAKAINLLQALIATPSFSREEGSSADLLEEFLKEEGIEVQRLGNNVFARSMYWNAERPTLLLNSHHDTVRPVSGWTRNPFHPEIENGKLYGLGSNDAGGSLVALLMVFVLYYRDHRLPVNLVFAASAEEEISGTNGIAALLPEIGKVDAAIVGEPTQMQMAVAEKGLMVVDAMAKGRAGHAAREEGLNAIYEALDDITFLRSTTPERISALLGKVKCTVTQIEAGTQHNVVPDRCSFVIDVRTNELYSNAEIYAWLQGNLKSELKARSLRLNSSHISMEHPLVKSGIRLGLSCFGSPTLSDQALMSFPSVKVGCGDSARSHTADEYIWVREIEEAIEIYAALIQGW